jgi:hypothetical protein
LSIRTRFAVAILVTAFVVVSLVRYFAGEPSAGGFFRVLIGILVWTPPKGALLRFMGGKRPNWSALAANTASELPGLGFPLSPLGVPWPALAVSFLVSTIIEWLALTVMGTARVRACFVMAVYVNIFAHVLVAGFFLWSSSRLAGGAVVFISFLIFIFPIFIKFVSNPAESGSR